MAETAAAAPAVPWARGWKLWLLPAGAVASFHVAYLVPALFPMGILYLACLFAFARGAPTPRQAFYGGLGTGMAVVGPWMAFLLGIFGFAGVVLWAIVAAWTGLFVLLLRAAFLRLGTRWALVLAPFLWTGVEYFRCELYPLKFTWLTPGFALGGTLPLGNPLKLGVYGAGFAMAAFAVTAHLEPRKVRWYFVKCVALLLVVLPVGRARTSMPLHVAGLQLEGADTDGIPRRLDRLLRDRPDTDLVVLPEYCFAGPVSDGVKAWCRRNRKHLIAGGMDLREGDEFRNTAYVIGPEGTVVFQQGKSVPIQFFRDGLPATEQGVWTSPWGRVGICVCYDLSYARVVDGLVEKGAQVIVVPTMDARHWGEAQHRLHARVAPVRSAEYGVPIVRVCSSGISQVTDDRGAVEATAPFPGEGEAITATVWPVDHGRIPWDRWLAPFCTAVAGAWMAWAFVAAIRDRLRRRPV